MQYITNSEKETKLLAEKLAQRIQQQVHHNNVVALTGELGAGKTTFVQGFTKGLGIKDKIISPTFVLIRQHQIPSSKKTLFHIDLYRLDNMGDLKELGLQEILQNPNNIVLIEWAEKIKDLPKNTKKITIEKLEGNKRLITIE